MCDFLYFYSSHIPLLAELQDMVSSRVNESTIYLKKARGKWRFLFSVQNLYLSVQGLIEMFGPGVKNLGVLRRARMFGRVTALCDFPSRCRREMVGGRGQCGLVPTGPSAPETPTPSPRAQGSVPGLLRGLQRAPCWDTGVRVPCESLGSEM